MVKISTCCSILLYKPLEGEFTFYNVAVEEIIEKVSFYKVDIKILFTGEALNDGRVSRILWRWENKCFIDPPIVTISNDRENYLAFSDGRHRTKVSYFLAQAIMPVALYNDQVEFISKILTLKLHT